ncbi:hypothetical protein V6N13_133842 [Hibiscus sabdariffa]
MDESGVHQNGFWKVDATKFVKGRSYRDALLNKAVCFEDASPKEVSKGLTSNVNGGISEALTSAKNGGEIMDNGVISMVVGEKEKIWLKQCLIGQIVPMYDVDFYHQVLASEGFKVSLSH